MEAVAIKNAILITSVHTIDGSLIIETSCRDYDEYVTLPNVVSYNDTVLGKTGWNSDRGYACYKSTVNVASF